tara:strand:- start:19072 stop:20454 length:1383 start_codon:yes stop_codon:yes gene_type:complete
MSQNIPVRFVRADGRTIQLPVTTLTLDVDRNFNATPIIFTGSSRIATDFNLSRAVIILEGVFTDDDLMNIGTAIQSKAIIDFSRIDETFGVSVNARFDDEFTIKNGFHNIILNDIASLTTPIKLKNTAGDDFELYAAKSDVSHGYTSSRHHFSIATTDGVKTTSTLVGGSGYSIANDITITATTGSGVNCKINITGVNSGAITSFEITHPGSGHAVGDVLTIPGGSGGTFTVASIGDGLTAEQMATNLFKLINDTPITGFSATRVTSPSSGLPNTAVSILQTIAGEDGNSGTPKLNDFRLATRDIKPRFETFSGGEDAGGMFHGMSAGDKVMSLYATLNNSNNPTFLQDITDGFRSLIGFNEKYGDYIIGVQIPFNSSINATDGNKYKPVNFFMPTGAFETLESKSVKDAVAASTEPENPDSNNDRSFIKGGVTKATFVQVGGEPVYSFNIQFIPASFII